MITREFPPASGGIGYYVYNLARKLIEKGHRVTVITRGGLGKTERKVTDGIEVFNVTFLPLYPFHMPLHGYFVNSLIKSLETKFDLIHLHSPLVPPIKTKLPIITTIHTAMRIDSRYHEVIDPYSLAEKSQSMYFSPNVESQLLRISKKITAVSPSVAEELREYKIDPKKVIIVWNGVDEKVFFPIKSKEGKYVLFTGVLRARKGLFDLMKCASLMPNTKFVICGTGPLLQKLKEQAHSSGLKNITFLGRVSRKRLIHIYQNATIQVVPSLYEGIPTVLLEAMACGLPIVASDIGGNRDLISSKVNGLLVPPRCPQEIVEAIKLLNEDESLRDNLGRCARTTIINQYTWDRIANNFVELYDKVLN